MQCPFCRTENRDERDQCYNCQKDLSMLRLITNKAKSHFNTALEYAERDRVEEAIAELDNALELDHSHVNSHVVLGTLYSKLGQYDKAEACWKEALAIDQRFEKAHQYLEKLDAGRKALPLVRRQRYLILILVVLSLFLAGTQIDQSVFRPYRMNLLRGALQAFQSSNYSEALDIIRKIPRHTRNQSAVQAEQLEEIITADMNLRLESAQAYLEQMKLDQAYRQIRILLDRRPPEAIRLKAVAQNTKITEATQGLVTEALAMFQSGEGTQAQLDSMLALYKRIAPPNPKDEFIANSEKARNAILRTRELETIAQAFNEGKMDRIALLGKLVNMRKQYPDYDKLPELIDKFAQPMEKKEIGIINAGIAGGDLKAADQAFENLKRILAIVAPENAAAQLAGYQQSLEQNRTARVMQELRTSFEAANYERTLEMAKEADSRPLKPEEKALIQAISKKANAKLAVARWIWMQDLEKSGKFSGGHLSLEEAEHTVAIYPQVSEFLPRAAYPKVDDDLLFFAAMAYRQIGQNPKANELFERLRKEFPKSNLIKMADYYTQIAEKKP